MYNLLSASAVYAHAEEDSIGHHMDFFGWWGGALWVILFWTLIILSVISLIYYLVKTQNTKKDSLEIIRERYAKGEIDKKEFEEKKKSLNR